MIFRVENLGPLEEAEVDLSKDLIVLAGPNNSGKTYLAWSLYGLFVSGPGTDAQLRELLNKEIFSEAGDSIQWEGLTPYWQRIASSWSNAFAEKLYLCFATSKDFFEKTKINLKLQEADALTQKLRERFEKNAQLERAVRAAQKIADAGGLAAIPDFGLNFYALASIMGSLSRHGPVLKNLLAVMSPQERGRALDFFVSILLRQASKVVFPNSVLFPAERIAVNIFAKELALKRTELVDDLLDADAAGSENSGEDDAASLNLVRRRAGRYPLPIRNSLLIANDLTNISKEKGHLAALADELETSVLRGGLSVSNEGEVVFAPSEAGGRQLSVHLTASVVKSLASLVFYFRHMAKEGDFIIIDEPELNLHPDNQRKIAQVLAKAVNSGIKVMISTHSDYVVREMNHLIMMSHSPQVEDRMVDEFGYKRGCALRPDRVGVYLFKDHRADPVKVTATGFEIKTIDEEINKLNQISQHLYSMLD